MKLLSKKTVHFSLLLIFLFGILYIGPQRLIGAAQNGYNKWMILTMIIDKIERFYVDEKNPEELFENAIHGILTGLDPHSVYLTPDRYAEWKKKYEGYRGIGLGYHVDDGKLVVVSLVDNGPAAAAGIRIGDKIAEIDGKRLADLASDQIRGLLTGPDGSSVSLLIQRRDVPDLFTLRVPRQRIFVDSIPSAFMYDTTTGYVKIALFNESTPDALDSVLEDLYRQGMQKLILDLRNNSGGALMAGIAVADRFLNSGKLIVFTKGRGTNSSEQYFATARKTRMVLPLIVLVNQATASDAEIVAGAIQDWDRGLIVGQRTFGKALVQTEYGFQDGSGLLLTTARYYTPLGRMIQRDDQNPDKAKASYSTPGNRIVYGGGGIYPDIVQPEKDVKLTEGFEKLLLSREHVFFKYADHFVTTHPEIATDRKTFYSQFEIGPAVLNDFINSANLGLSRSEIDRNREHIRFILKREIAGRLWGEKGRHRVNALADPQLRDCIKYFPQAENLQN
jgi:carboxyl-terminal processing protease